MELESFLKHYVAENATLNLSVNTLWEAHKIVIWGQCITLFIIFKKNVNATRILAKQKP